MPAAQAHQAQVVGFVLGGFIRAFEDVDLRRLAIALIAQELELRLAEVTSQADEIDGVERVGTETEQVIIEKRRPDRLDRGRPERSGEVQAAHLGAERRRQGLDTQRRLLLHAAWAWTSGRPRTLIRHNSRSLSGPSAKSIGTAACMVEKVSQITSSPTS